MKLRIAARRMKLKIAANKMKVNLKCNKMPNIKMFQTAVKSKWLRRNQKILEKWIKSLLVARRNKSHPTG